MDLDLAFLFASPLVAPVIGSNKKQLMSMLETGLEYQEIVKAFEDSPKVKTHRQVATLDTVTSLVSSLL